MLKDAPKLLEDLCKWTEVLECFSLRRDKFKNPDYLPVLPISGLCCRMALMLKDEPKLLENIDRVTRVLELLSDKEFKNRNDVNEILSLKYHILHYIVKVSGSSQVPRQKISVGTEFIFWTCQVPISLLCYGFRSLLQFLMTEDLFVKNVVFQVFFL